MNLVERLRSHQEDISNDMTSYWEVPEVCIEAADRIEQLESALKMARDALNEVANEMTWGDRFTNAGQGVLDSMAHINEVIGE